MPIDRRELDEVTEIAFQRYLDQMLADKFYSVNEMSLILVGRKIQPPESLQEYLAWKEGEEVSLASFLPKLALYLGDSSYVWSVLVALAAAGRLQAGMKDGEILFCKR